MVLSQIAVSRPSALESTFRPSLGKHESAAAETCQIHRDPHGVKGWGSEKASREWEKKLQE